MKAAVRRIKADEEAKERKAEVERLARERIERERKEELARKAEEERLAREKQARKESERRAEAERRRQEELARRAEEKRRAREECEREKAAARKAEEERLAEERIEADRRERDWTQLQELRAGDRKVATIKGVEYAFRWCPAGSFVMGNAGWNWFSSVEKSHRVTLTNGFWMLETAVTQEMWESVMGNNPSLCKGNTHPV